MSFLHPTFLWASGLIAAAVVGLHFLSTLQPRRDVFPTVRFVPEAPLHSTALAMKFSDGWLLLLRVLAVLLIGTAFAQPRFTLWRQSVARIVAVDISGSVVRSAAWRDQVTRATAGAATVVLFDTTAREVTVGSRDSLLSLPLLADDASSASAASPVSPGKLSVALIAALRAGARLRESANSVELTIVSPFLAASVDRATPKLRELWPGHIELVKAEAAQPSATPPSVEVEWTDAAPSPFWVRRTQDETSSGVYSEAATLIAPFERKWRLAKAPDATTRVIARWLDGEPAAVEQNMNGVIKRSVGFSFPQQGDTVLRPEFVRFTESLKSSAGSSAALQPLDATALASLADAAPTSKAVVTPGSTTISPWVVVLLEVGFALLIFELFIRRRTRRTTAAATS
jgi:hypothetical protein